MLTYFNKRIILQWDKKLWKKEKIYINRDTWMKGRLYLNGSGRRVSGHTDENDHDRWNGKRHYAAMSSTQSLVSTDAETCSSGKLIDRGFVRLVMHTSWKTCGVPRVSCSHEIYRGLRSPLFRKGCKVAQTRRVAGFRRRLDIHFSFHTKFNTHVDT